MALLYHNNNSISNVTSFAQVPAGEPVLLSTATASSSASIEFNSTYINSDYKIYKFEFTNIACTQAGRYLRMNLSTDNGSNYNVVKTTTCFLAYHDEGDTATSLNYETGADLAQSTGGQNISYDQGEVSSDQGMSGSMYLFNPSSTTYVKHFLVRTNVASGGSPFYYTTDFNVAGYGNTTSAVNAIHFIYNSGSILSGTFKLYGIGAN